MMVMMMMLLLIMLLLLAAAEMLVLKQMIFSLVVWYLELSLHRCSNCQSACFFNCRGVVRAGFVHRCCSFKLHDDVEVRAAWDPARAALLQHGILKAASSAA
jgi:hypothetical protein